MLDPPLHAAALRKPRLDALTSLRFFAAAMIVLHHLKGNSGVPATLPFNLDNFLGLGVSFFFLLSGFILVYNYPSLSELGGEATVSRCPARAALAGANNGPRAHLPARTGLRVERGSVMLWSCPQTGTPHADKLSMQDNQSRAPTDAAMSVPSGIVASAPSTGFRAPIHDYLLRSNSMSCGPEKIAGPESELNYI